MKKSAQKGFSFKCKCNCVPGIVLICKMDKMWSISSKWKQGDYPLPVDKEKFFPDKEKIKEMQR